MKELHINTKQLLTVVVMSVILAISILVIKNFPLIHEADNNVSSLEEQEETKTASPILETFFQINYQEGKETWLERICSFSTPAGCELLRLGSGQMWQTYLDDQTQVTASVVSTEEIVYTDTEQVWQVEFALSSPLPGSNRTEDSAFILLVLSEGEWKFERFLLETEIEALDSRLPTTGEETSGGQS